MRRVVVRYLVTLAAWTVVFNFGPEANSPSVACAAEPARLPPRISRCPTPQITKALAEKTTVEFVDAPLQDVVDYLRDLHNIEIQLDCKAMQAGEYRPRFADHAEYQGRLASSRTGYHPPSVMNLTWVADDEVIVITTPATAQSGLTVRLYDCSWATDQQFRQLIEAIKLVDVRPQVVTQKAPAAGGGDSCGAEVASDFKLVTFGVHDRGASDRARTRNDRTLVGRTADVGRRQGNRTCAGQQGSLRLRVIGLAPPTFATHLDEEEVLMRRSIVCWTAVSLMCATVAVAPFSAPNLPHASAGPPAAPQTNEPAPAKPAPVARIRVAPQTNEPAPAKPAPVARIRVAPQPSARICKALKEPTVVEFVDAPLQDVVDFFKDLHNIEIQLDTKALERRQHRCGLAGDVQLARRLVGSSGSIYCSRTTGFDLPGRRRGIADHSCRTSRSASIIRAAVRLLVDRTGSFRRFVCRD